MAEKRLRSFGDFYAAVGVGELELATAGADGAGEGVAADGTGGGEGQIGGNPTKGSARGDVVAQAFWNLHADRGEGSFQGNVATAVGGTRGGDEDSSILIIDGDLSSDGFEGDAGK